MTVDDVKERARELMKIGNDIEEKVEQTIKLEKEIEILQVYRNERGDQLLHVLMEQEKEEKKKETDTT